MAFLHDRLYRCWICGNVAPLEKCKIDEHGRAVHEDCYVAKLAFQNGNAPQSPNSAYRRRSGLGILQQRPATKSVAISRFPAPCPGFSTIESVNRLLGAGTGFAPIPTRRKKKEPNPQSATIEAAITMTQVHLP
jgi:hypothetical protein